jgi:hypothetical protein
LVQIIDDDLKTQSAKYWKYISSFSKRNSRTIQLDVNGAYIVDPQDVAEAFAKQF